MRRGVSSVIKRHVFAQFRIRQSSVCECPRIQPNYQRKGTRSVGRNTHPENTAITPREKRESLSLFDPALVRESLHNSISLRDRHPRRPRSSVSSNFV